MMGICVSCRHPIGLQISNNPQRKRGVKGDDKKGKFSEGFQIANRNGGFERCGGRWMK